MKSNKKTNTSQQKNKKGNMAPKYNEAEMENDSQELIKDIIEEQDIPFAMEMQSFNPEEKNIGQKIYQNSWPRKHFNGQR